MLKWELVYLGVIICPDVDFRDKYKGRAGEWQNVKIWKVL